MSDKCPSFFAVMGHLSALVISAAMFLYILFYSSILSLQVEPIWYVVTLAFGLLIVNSCYNLYKILFSKDSQTVERLKKIFLELRDEKGIIDTNIKLVENTEISNFQGLNFFCLFKLLRYNPIFFRNCLSQYNDNILRFVLLHEAGHIETRSWFRIENILAGFIVVAIVIGVIGLLIGGIFGAFFSIFCGVVLIAIVCWVIKSWNESMKNDEFIADAHALKKMQENYNLSNPCSFIDEVFDAMKSIGEDPAYKELVIKIMDENRIQKKLIEYSRVNDYHPTNEERVSRLKKIAKCK